MKKIRLKKQKHPILKIIETNQKYTQNTVIQLNTTKITLEPQDKVTVKDNYLIIGEEQEPESIININQIIYVSQQ